MLEEYLKTMRLVLEGGDDSSILNSNDSTLIILYRIFRFTYIYRSDSDSITSLQTKKSMIQTRILPFTSIKIIITSHNDLGGHHYIIMKNKIILLEYKDVFPNLEKIYDLIKENY